MAYSGQPRRRARRNGLGIPVRIEERSGDTGYEGVVPIDFNPAPAMVANAADVIQTSNGPLRIEPISATPQVLNAGAGASAAPLLPIASPTATTLTVQQSAPAPVPAGLFQSIPPWGWALAAMGLLVWLGKEN